MKVRLVLGVILVVIGGVWFIQGIGVLGGSFMSGTALWAVIGAITVFLGGSLLASTRRTRD